MSQSQRNTAAARDRAVKAGANEYSRPRIIHELELETRAGSPLNNMPNPLDPTGISPSTSD